MTVFNAASVRLAARSLAKHPGFASVAIISLGLAIGLNTTMYSMIDALVNPNVAMRSPGQLYGLRFFGDLRHQLDVETKNSLLRSGVNGFEALTGEWPRYDAALIENGASFQNGDVTSVAPNYFTVLGVRPMAGRLFTDADLGATPPPVIIAERLARDLFPGGETPVGRRIDIQGAAHVVIGMLDRASDFPQSRTVAWTLPAPGVRLASLPLDIVRLRDGVTPKQIEGELAVLSNRIASQVGGLARDNRLSLRGALKQQFHVGNFHIALIAAVIAVLLIACANLANLQLARGIARSRELATRAALGASRRDIITHLALESALLAVAGLVLGLVLAFWGMHLIRASIPASIGQYIVEPQTSWRLFAFASVAAVVCLVFVGLAPAVRVSRVDIIDLIKRGAGTGSTRAARRQYGFLIVAEIGFALVVVCGAALLVRAARQFNDEAAMWDQSKLAEVMLRVNVPSGETRALADVGAELVGRMRAIGDVADAAVVSRHANDDGEITATDASGAMRVVPAPMSSYDVVTPSYFRAMGFEIGHGRDFREGEQGAVAIVDPQMARRLWPNTAAVGQMIKFGSRDKPGRWYTVIGVRKPVGIESTNLTATSGAAYVLTTEGDRLVGGKTVWKNPSVDLILRARRNPQRVPVVARGALSGDARFMVLFAGTFDEYTGAAAQRQNHNFVGALFSIFALLALALAALGVYGIVAHSVAERRREIGVRLALGSSGRGILRVVMREGNVFALAGVALGLLLIRMSAVLVRQFLQFPEGDMYSIELYVPAALFIFGVAVVAALIPAVRATRIDPVESLRCE